MNEAVLSVMEHHVLTPGVVESVIELTERDDVHEQKRTLEVELRHVDKKLKYLTAAIEEGGPITTLTTRIRELEERRSKIERDIAACHSLPRPEPKVVEDVLADWRRQLRASTTQGRAVLQQILQGRITFNPVGTYYEMEATTKLDNLFLGFAGPGRGKKAKKPEWIPEEDVDIDDTAIDAYLDGRYRAILQRAYDTLQKNPEGMASPTGVEPVLPP